MPVLTLAGGDLGEILGIDKLMRQRLENRLGTLGDISASSESESHGSKLLGSALVRDGVAQRLKSELGRGQGLVVVRHSNMLLTIVQLRLCWLVSSPERPP